MGCVQSKAPPLPLPWRGGADPTPVALCHARSALLGEAIRRRYALADAHRAYADSLHSAGAALHDLLHAVLHDFPAPPPALPAGAATGADDEVLLLSDQGKEEEEGERAGGDDDDGGHIQFPPSDDDENDGHIQFPPEENEEEAEEEEDDDSADQPDDEEEETEEDPEIEHIPRPDRRQPVVDEEADNDDDENEHLLPRIEHRLRPKSVQPAASPFPTPQRMHAAAPYGYPPPPYTYGPGQSYPYGGGAYTAAATTGTYSSYGGGGYGAGTDTYGGAYTAGTDGTYGAAMTGTYGGGGAYTAGTTGTYGGGVYTAATGTYGAGTGGYDAGASSYAYGGGAAMDDSSRGGYGVISTINYARGQPPPPSVTYEHRRPQVTNARLRYYRNNHHGATGGPAPLPLPAASSSYSSSSSSYGSGGRYPYPGYNNQYPPQGGTFYSPAAPSSSYHHQPPSPPSEAPPPSPPKVPSWDFLNPFEPFESYYPSQMSAALPIHSPSWTSSEPPNDEGMPELEVDDDMPDLEEDVDPAGEAVVGEGEEPRVGGAEEAAAVVVNDDAGNKLGKNKEEEENKMSSGGDGSSEEEEMHPKPVFVDASAVSVGEESSKASEEDAAAGGSPKSSTVVHAVVDKSLVEEQQVQQDSADVTVPPAAAADTQPEPEPEKVYNDYVAVVHEVRAQFERASKSAGELGKALEVGKVPYNYNPNNLGTKVSVPSLMICGFPKMRKKKFLKFEEEKAMESGNISTTLQKLYLWEKKLLEEVKAEEKIRVQYDQKYQEAKYLYKTGAEAHKLEQVQIQTRQLATKISVAIKSINTISNEIHKLRDEELWPQIHELIQGFMQMWHTMSECHQIQCHALSQAKDIDSTLAAATFSQAHIDLIKQLELQLLDMTANFATWFSAQKSYVSTLNEWLKKGVEYVPEVTDDGVVPFSPGRLGAPPVFTICNNWATSIARISEVEVVDAMQAFASSVLGLWERHRSEWRQVMFLADNTDNMGRELRSMTREELSMRKALKAQNKMLVRVSSQDGGVSSLSAQMLHDRVPRSEVGLQSCMHKSFEAMESLATACANALKDLHLRCEEERARMAQEDGAAAS